MLRLPHRRRSSALSSNQGSISVPARHRGESFASAGEHGMVVVRDEAEQGEEEEESGSRRQPLRLRGRGGFSHPRGYARAHGRATSSGNDAALSSPTATSSKAQIDSVDSLASGMAALQFVPHSVRIARGRGRGRGG